MITEVLRVGNISWVDVVEPTELEMQKIVAEYNLPKRVVYNCLDPEHLPKAEKFEEVLFVLIRTFDENSTSDADSVQEITRKLAFFIEPERIITVHRKEQRFLEVLKARWKERAPTASVDGLVPRIFLDILEDALMTFDESLDRDIATLEDFEYKSFRFEAPPTVIEDSYYLKRRASVFRRIIRSTQDTMIRMQTLGAPQLQGAILNGREVMDHLYFKADDLQESVNSLLNLYISLTSQKANETMKVLTVFSVFFLPLSFIAGLYGMNFKFMPELEWAAGYPFALGLMVVTAFGIYFWFRRKRLL